MFWWTTMNIIVTASSVFYGTTRETTFTITTTCICTRTGCTTTTINVLGCCCSDCDRESEKKCQHFFLNVKFGSGVRRRSDWLTYFFNGFQTVFLSDLLHGSVTQNLSLKKSLFITAPSDCGKNVK